MDQFEVVPPRSPMRKIARACNLCGFVFDMAYRKRLLDSHSPLAPVAYYEGLCSGCSLTALAPIPGDHQIDERTERRLRQLEGRPRA